MQHAKQHARNSRKSSVGDYKQQQQQQQHVICAPPAPPPPPPSPHRTCTVATQLGCFDNSKGAAVLTLEEEQYHDDVTLENCAGLCAAAQMLVAGVDGGNHCWCGPAGAEHSASAAAHARPMSECIVESCPGKYGDHCSCTGNPKERCGAAGRLLVYNYSRCQ